MKIRIDLGYTIYTVALPEARAAEGRNEYHTSPSALPAAPRTAHPQQTSRRRPVRPSESLFLEVRPHGSGTQGAGTLQLSS